MKRIFLFVLLGYFHSSVIAQSRGTEIEYQKVSRAAIINELPFPSRTVENAIEDAFIKKGYKGTSAKGFTLYKGVKMHEFGPDTYDIYIMVERKSRKENDVSNVTMMISKGFDAFVSKSSDEQVFRNAHTYLDSLRNSIAAYDLELQIAGQEDEIRKMEKKNIQLQDEEKELEKKKRKIEDQLAENKKDQQNQVSELEKQNQVLEVLKGKRK